MLSNFFWLIKNLIKKFNKKTNQKDLIKMAGSKSICPKWHFGQVEHGNNWGIFWSMFLVGKIEFSYNALNNCHPPMHHMFASLFSHWTIEMCIHIGNAIVPCCRIFLKKFKNCFPFLHFLLQIYFLEEECWSIFLPKERFLGATMDLSPWGKIGWLAPWECSLGEDHSPRR